MCVGAAASDSCRCLDRLHERETLELLSRRLLEKTATAALAGDLAEGYVTQDGVKRDFGK